MAEEPLIFPQPITPAVAEVLKMMLWDTGPIAHAFRAAGYDIQPRAEDEQAFALAWLLPFAIKHGGNWRQEAAKEIRAIRERIQSNG